MAGEIKVTFAALAEVQAAVRATTDRMHQQLGDLRQDLAPLVATWEGRAAADYAERQRQWDAAAADLTAVLGRIAVAVGMANDGYQEVERANARRWA